ncbi:diguanylate cyclase [Sorangium sp. So ce1504]|uniref:diguanylate cyclase n=1 Tax=Sorangium sp. So ce1504 TaxID=3133337 RepID=UPI003F623EBF
MTSRPDTPPMIRPEPTYTVDPLASLTHVKLLAKELLVELTAEDGTDAVATFAKIENEWHNALAAEKISEEQRSTLEGTLAERKSLWIGSTSSLYVPIVNKQLVARVSLTKEPDATCVRHFARRIELVASSVDRTLEAHHDRLTGLLNRAGLYAALHNWQPPTGIGQHHTNPMLPRAKSGPLSLVTIVVDADHFKQINDSYGHIYGDVVLKCIAVRLQRLTEDESRTAPTSLRNILTSRDGGEEFLVVVLGTFEKGWVEAFATRIRETIGTSELPSDSELRAEPNIYANISANVPLASARRVTVSVGLSGSTINQWPQKQDLDAKFNSVKMRADMALYRAKSAGRNHVCVFSNIANEYGRILEHHPDTDAVAIDLGRQDAVDVGQEFHVYHPDFTGKKDFYVSDGRTKRRRGSYPKRSCGRIIVFEAQEEMSFCHVAGERTVSRFPPGCALEAVPIGSIAHLLPVSTLTTAAPLTTSEFIEASIAQLAKSDKNFAVIVIGIDNLYELGQRHGNAAINQMLAQVYEIIRNNLGPKPLVSQIRPSQFAIVVEDSHLDSSDIKRSLSYEYADHLDDELEHISTELQVRVPTPGTVCIGVAYGQHSEYDARHAFELARYAASPYIDDRSKISRFNIDCAERLLGGLYLSGKAQNAISDYRRLREIGIESSVMSSTVSICAMQNGSPDPDLEFALETARRATEKDPHNTYAWFNRGTVEYVSGSKIAAYDSFSKGLGASGEELDERVDAVYLVPYALALWAKHSAEPLSVSRDVVATALRKAVNADSPVVSGFEWEDVETVLKQLDAAPEAPSSKRSK